ncbi:MAG: ATP-binding protein [Nitrospinales bacterium]
MSPAEWFSLGSESYLKDFKSKMEKFALDTLLKSINEDSSLNSLIQSSPICHKIFDPQLKLKFMSKSGVDALLIEHVEDLYGKDFPPDSAPKATREIFNETMHLAAKGETHTIEYSFEIAGNVIWYRTTISPYFNASGKLIYVKADSMDVTDTKKAEETSRTLLETTDICLKEIHKNDGPGYTLMFMSPAGRKQLGITDDSELVGKNYPLDIYPEEARKILLDGLDRVVSTGDTTQVECNVFDTKGKSIWFLSNISVQRRNEAGEVVSITVASQDVTEQVLNREALAKSKEIAEKANKAKSEFLSRMSHEFRTPLNAILGFSQLMSMDQKSLNVEQLENIESISSSGKHLMRLINDILDLAQVESGKSRVSIVPVSIVEILDDLVLLARPMANDNGINLTFNKKEGLNLSIMADKTRLKQVILNLISNAIKYNKPNGCVDINLNKTSDRMLRISVTDTGLGIAEDQQEGLFEPFNRLGAEKTNTEGTGIGLSITKFLIELMNGNIGFTSILGKGSSFYIELPICESKKSIKVGRRENDGELGAMTKKDNKIKILYVEDKPDNLELVRQILQSRKNIDIIAAPDARLGIDFANVHQPDLILMDINLPGLDGVEACRILSNDPKTSKIPIIAVSANAMKNEIKKSMDAGFIDYITKPIDVSQFLAKIDQVFN